MANSQSISKLFEMPVDDPNIPFICNDCFDSGHFFTEFLMTCKSFPCSSCSQRYNLYKWDSFCRYKPLCRDCAVAEDKCQNCGFEKPASTRKIIRAVYEKNDLLPEDGLIETPEERLEREEAYQDCLKALKDNASHIQSSWELAVKSSSNPGYEPKLELNFENYLLSKYAVMLVWKIDSDLADGPYETRGAVARKKKQDEEIQAHANGVQTIR